MEKGVCKANLYRMPWYPWCGHSGMFWRSFTKLYTHDWFLGRARLQRFRNLGPMPTYPCRIWLLWLGASAKSVCAITVVAYSETNSFILYSFRVNAPSKEHMCKSVVMENTRCTHEDISGIYWVWCKQRVNELNPSVYEIDPNYSRYYCVITQVGGARKGVSLMRITQLMSIYSMSNLSTLRKCWTFAEAWKIRRLAKSTTTFD